MWKQSEFMDSFLLLPCFLSLLLLLKSFTLGFSFLALLALSLSVSSSLSFLSLSLLRSLLFSVALRSAKVQRRGLPVVDDQRGFPFSTPCCCTATIATPPPSSSLPSSSLFFRALGSTRMIILHEKIQRELHERL